ncbi:MAG: hypothetical protein LBU58_07240, partial [Clostridiales bacterium]|nr:hypothetical protein [Clostridiales bacterium]
AIREFILEVNRERGTTFLITTHDMNDIESVCRRLILIDAGELRYDGALKAFKAAYGDRYVISVRVKDGRRISHPLLQPIRESDGAQEVLGSKAEIGIADAVTFLTQQYEVADIEIRDSNVESILRDIYAQNNGAKRQ